MTASNIEHEELFRLLSAYCAQQLDDTDAQRLADMLRDDPEARRIYIEYTDLHSTLAWNCSSIAELDAAIDASVESAPQTDEDDRPTLRRALQGFVSKPQRLAMTVASLVVVAVLGLLALAPAPFFRNGASNDEHAPERVVAAKITDTVDCVWEETALPVGHGSDLYKGQQIELLEGTAEITFRSGAKVTLKGPAAYVIDSGSSSSLRHGELAAHVPPHAVGFAVNTPTAIVVDLGTEFGVLVKPKQESQPPREEVHVFTGVVEVSFPDGKKQRLSANQAVRITGSAEAEFKVERLAASHRHQFPQFILAGGDSSIADILPTKAHPPVTRSLTLWLSADGAVRLDSENHVRIWGDMRAGDNVRAQNATQHLVQNQPRLVSDCIAGRPALQFDGDDYLTLATPANLGLQGEPYEMFIVARSASPEIQFLIGGAVEDFELHINGVSGARFIPVGHVAPGDYSDLGTHAQFSDGKAHVYCARVLADESHHGIVAVDGQETADVLARDCRSTNNTALRLGMRHNASYGLRGEIAEVLVYCGALSDTQRRQVQSYLCQKYMVPQ